MLSRSKFAARLCLLTIPFALTACTPNYGPYPMPTGYTHHSQPYKAPTGPEPRIIKQNPIYVKGQMCDPVNGLEKGTKPGGVCLAPTDGPVSTDVSAGIAAPPATVMTDSIGLANENPEAWNAAAQDLLTRLLAQGGRPTGAVYLEPAPGDLSHNADFKDALYYAAAAQGLDIAAPGAGTHGLRYGVTPTNGVKGEYALNVALITGGATVAEQSGTYNVITGSGVSAPMETVTPVEPVASYAPEPTSAPVSTPAVYTPDEPQSAPPPVFTDTPAPEAAPAAASDASAVTIDPAGLPAPRGTGDYYIPDDEPLPLSTAY